MAVLRQLALAVCPLVFPALPAVTIGRDDAHDAAQRELSKLIYHRDDPSLFVQLLQQLAEWIQRILGQAAGIAPGGWAGLVGILVLVVVLVVAIRLRTGPVGRSRARGEPLLSGRARTADEHRRAAERFSAGEQWAEALRERLRAVARDLEERAILEPRPGRTADELAVESGVVLPGHAAELHAVTRVFDDVWYGGRGATPGDYGRARDLDEALRGARPTLVGDRS